MTNPTPASQIIEDMRGIQSLLTKVSASGSLPPTANAALRIVLSSFPREDTFIADERGVPVPYGSYATTPLFGKALLRRRSPVSTPVVASPAVTHSDKPVDTQKAPIVVPETLAEGTPAEPTRQPKNTSATKGVFGLFSRWLS